MRAVVHVSIFLMLAAASCFAQPAGSAIAITYVPGSSVKLEQIMGDRDYQTNAPTTSQTVTRFNILGNDIAYSFEDNGKLIFLFGDTISSNPSVVNYHAHDPIAWSTTADPEAGLLLNFYTNGDGTPLFVEPPGVPMGPDDVPNSGISLADGIYIVCNTGSDTSLPEPHQNDYSVLTHFDENSRTFTTGRTISKLPGGHFIITALHTSGTDVLMFGVGAYRASDIYLAKVPASSFASGTGTQYFTGLLNGQPAWSSSESDAVPVVQDNPLGGPAWPNDSPTIGNVSIAYSGDLGLWLMTYDGGRQSQKTTGVYFTYASQPWGPWAAPQLIFNAVRDHGLGAFMHDPSIVPDPPGDGLNGPTIGGNDPYLTRGADYAPLMIERFTRVSDNTLKIYYTMSTWNPYTNIKMRSEFALTTSGGPVLSTGTLANGATYQAGGLVPGSWAQIKGVSLATVSRGWVAADLASLGNNLPTSLSGTSVTVNGTPAAVYYVSPNQVDFQVPAGVTGNPSVQVILNSAASNLLAGAAAASSPGIWPIIVNGTNYAAAVFSDGKFAGDPSIGALFRNAKPGDSIQLFGTGLASSPAGVRVNFQPITGVTVTLGNVTVPADAAGLVAIGEFQINFTVPQQFATLPAGNYPLTVAINGVSSPATINSNPPAPLVIPIQH